MNTLKLNEVKQELFESYNEFIAGYLAACTSITFLFPLNKIIYRQQLHGIDAKIAVEQMKKDGIQRLYRGLLPPLLQKSTSYSIMFGTQRQYYLIIKSFVNDSNAFRAISTKFYGDALLNGFGGFFAGLTEAALTPFERVQGVLQMEKYHHHYKNTFHAFKDIRQTFGFKELYRGYSAICFRNSLSNSIFFGLREPLKNLFPKPSSQFENILYNFVNGGFLGAVISTIFYPINVVKTSMQSKVGGTYDNMLTTLRQVLTQRNHKNTSIFIGVSGNFWRAVLSWGLTNSSFEFYVHSLKAIEHHHHLHHHHSHDDSNSKK